ncbi:MAG TPA: RIP metalloprotease RseP [Rhodobacteraceae bacterium]|nr:RIP metalloprotease RseP [Paracoccaceae bacterium]
MDWLANIPLIGSPLITILAFIVLMGIVVTIHEYGHYIVGRWVGIHAEVFSLGFGPTLWSRVDKRGTKWQVAAVPLGGYVKFLGDRDAASTAASEAMNDMNDYDRRRSFPAAAVWRRFLTVLAGPVFNFILSAAIFTSLVFWQGVAVERPTVGEVTPLPFENPLQSGDVILAINDSPVPDYEAFSRALNALRQAETYENILIQVQRDGEEIYLTTPYFMPPLVSSVVPLTPAYKAGLKPGDVILSVNGEDIGSFEALRSKVEAALDKKITLLVWREGTELELSLSPALVDHPLGDGTFEERVQIGVGGDIYFAFMTETPSFLKAAEIGTRQVYTVMKSSLNGLKHIILGNISVKNLQGPIGIAQISSAAVQTGTFDFIFLIGVISTAIGLLNLFPIPVLDGGHLVTYVYEAIMRKPPNPRFLQGVMAVGMVLLLSMMLLATYNDIMRL